MREQFPHWVSGPRTFLGDRGDLEGWVARPKSHPDKEVWAVLTLVLQVPDSSLLLSPHMQPTLKGSVQVSSLDWKPR